MKSNVTDNKWRFASALCLVAMVTVVVYWPVLHNDFIDFDDDVYVTVNRVVQQGLSLNGFLWALTTFHAGNWHPLTWLSHMLDVSLFGSNPAGHHATNLILHAANTLLLCALLCRLTGFVGRSLAVALLFALHPLHVESVAWVAERKDLLSTLFWLLTMCLYVWYAGKPSMKRYLPVAIFFALGLMAKQMPVTLPIVLLLMDYWPLNRATGVNAKTLLAEKIPLLVLAAAASFMILRAHAVVGALLQTDQGSMLLHSGNALISYVKYIRNMFWPADLALFYPFESDAVTPLKVAGAFGLLLAITVLVATQRKSRPYLLFGWLWYLITLVPVIGFIRVGGQALADRYTYVPLIGVFLIIVWGVTELAGQWRHGVVVAGCGMAAVIVILSVVTIKQIRYWQNSHDLFAHALAVVPRNWLAHNNMGILLAQHNRNDEALQHFQESVRLNPKGIEGFRNLGNSLLIAGRNSEAIEAFRQAVWINANDPESHYRLGYAYLIAGNSDFAQQEYRQLQRLNAAYASSLLDSIRILGKH
ncbi:transmembrane and TPR repeat-containing protein F38B6.6 [Geobacter sp. OR-1]|uniref:tetratricopeptide repeat protein n=1 Tax=Geobacter sp. OR-1 TaxID=1266765 RepID=UPI0005423674|nr:tetratricopeptide repeat protein [Geobacter sp. OR-1]GAM08029.1 transmembrane and TPR repeat-containing protein F38B6.6 [Geobacter sp. OR-1]